MLAIVPPSLPVGGREGGKKEYCAMEYYKIYLIVLEWNETTFWNRKKDFQELLFFLLLQKRESVEVILRFLPSFQTLYHSLLNTTRTHNSSPFTLASFYYFLAHLVKLGPIHFLISYYFLLFHFYHDSSFYFSSLSFV